MAAAAPKHPTEQTLHLYGLGKLDDAAAESVSKHLESCSDCRSRVAEMSSDSFLGRLRNAQGRRDNFTASWPPTPVSETDGGPSGPDSPPPASTMPPGLADHPDYEVMKELGRGGMGVVYLARNRLMGRDEVLKVMGRHIMERPGVMARFLAEIRAVARLQHPNIVTAYSAFRLGESIVFAMEYVEGLDLARLVKAKGPLPIANACYFVNQAAQGMQHAHERGMVHRDIKPGNLMLSHKGQRPVIKVLDFGLAKATREAPVDGGLTNPGQALGTPDYMAPEQIRDAQKADIRADIYSLGCTLYYLLSGGPPFRADNLWDLYQAHHSMDAKLLNFVRPDVPSELAALVAKMMAKEPERRLQTPAEVAQALAPFFRKGNAKTQEQRADISQVGEPAVQSRHVEIPSVPAHPATSLAPSSSAPAKRPSRREQQAPAWESLIEFKDTEPLKELPPRLVTRPRAERPSWLWPAAAAGILLLGLAAVWAGIVLTVRAPDGNLVLENVPLDAVVEVDGKNVTVTPAEGKPLKIQLEPGTHNVVVKRDDLVLTGESVTIQSGKDFNLTVRREAAVASRLAPTGSNSTPGPTHETPQPITRRDKFTVLSGKWSLNGDELVQRDTTSWFNELSFGDDQWTDYDFTVDAMRVDGGNSFSLLFRGTGPDDLFDYRIAGDDNKACTLQARDGGKSNVLKSYQFRLRHGAWYTARVHVRGSHFVCSIYDSQNSTETRVFDINDGRHPRGRVGLQTFGASVRFKNIKVTAPDGSVLWEGLPAVGSANLVKLSPKVDPPIPVDARNGFVPLFNGRDIVGWTAWGKQGRLSKTESAGIWRVRDGILHGIGGLSHLFSPRGDYQNFRVNAEVKINDGGNSGIFLRIVPKPGHLSSGYEAQINSTHSDPNKTGSLYRVPRPPIRVSPSPVPPDKWFTLEAEAVGGRIRIWVNGNLCVDWVDPQNTYTHGHIAIQSHHPGSHVQIRKLEVQELDQAGRPIVVVGHPADAREFRGKFYKLFPQKLSWHDASLKCRELGGHLAVVKGEQENRFLMSLLKDQRVDVAWLGATDEQVEGRWEWVDGELMRYTNWSPIGRQPNNKNGLEHYLIMMLAHDGRWSDQPDVSVETSPGFICQWD